MSSSELFGRRSCSSRRCATCLTNNDCGISDCQVTVVLNYMVCPGILNQICKASYYTKWTRKQVAIILPNSFYMLFNFMCTLKWIIQGGGSPVYGPIHFNPWSAGKFLCSFFLSPFLFRRNLSLSIFLCIFSS